MFLCFLLAFTTLGTVWAQSDNETLKISTIKIEGNKNVSSLVIYGHLQEKEGDLFSLRRIRMDIHNLFSMGDFKNIQVDAEPGSKTGQIVLIFKMEERPLISKMIFRGNKKWNSKKFLEQMKLSPKSAFDQSKLAEDILAIKKLYLDEGYSNVNVNAETKENPQDNSMVVIFDIFEGNQIKIGGIEVIGAQVFSQKKVIDQMKENHLGDKFKPDLLEDDLKLVEDFYHDEGYLKAAVLNHKERFDERRKREFITFTINEGVKFNMGTIHFQGNAIFDDAEMAKAFGIKKGDLLRKKGSR